MELLGVLHRSPACSTTILLVTNTFIGLQSMDATLTRTSYLQQGSDEPGLLFNLGGSEVREV